MKVSPKFSIQFQQIFLIKIESMSYKWYLINISQLTVHHFTFWSIHPIKTLSVSLCYKVNRDSLVLVRKVWSKNWSIFSIVLLNLAQVYRSILKLHQKLWIGREMKYYNTQNTSIMQPDTLSASCTTRTIFSLIFFI